MCIVMVTTSNNHAPALSLAQDLKCTLCESTSKLKMVIEKNGHVISFKIFSSRKYTILFSTNYSNKSTHFIATRGKSSHTNLKWAYLRIVNFNCLLLSPPIPMGTNPTRTQL